MPTLQALHLPDDLYQRLLMRAEVGQRSLAQQTVAELRHALGPGGQVQRQAVLQRLAHEQKHRQPLKLDPQQGAEVRIDRSR
jgi:hypothetical protein